MLAVALVIADYCIGLALRKALKASPDGRYFKADYSLNKCQEDVIILGSSRAETNYVPNIFEESLGLSCWNTGRGGQTLPFWWAMEKGILARYTPKVVVVNVETEFLSESLAEGFQRAGFLRPYYHDNNEIRPIINRISAFEKFYMFSNVYTFNSSFYYLLRPYALKNLDGRREDNGWKARESMMVSGRAALAVHNSSREINKETLELFEEFISDLTKSGSKVFIAISPDYGKLVESTSTIEYIMEMEGITVLNFSNDPAFSGKAEYFSDENHLNVTGAIKYSEEVCKAIRKWHEGSDAQLLTRKSAPSYQ